MSWLRWWIPQFKPLQSIKMMMSQWVAHNVTAQHAARSFSVAPSVRRPKRGGTNCANSRCPRVWQLGCLPKKKWHVDLQRMKKISWSKHINKDHQIHCFSSSVDSTVPNQTEFKLSSSIWEKIQSLAQCRSLPAFFHRNGGRTNHFVGVGVGKMHVISSWCTVQVSIRICCYVLKFERLYLLQTTQHSKTPKRVMKLHRSMKSNNQMKPFVSPVYSEPLVARQLHRTSSMQDLRMDHRTHVSFP